MQRLLFSRNHVHFLISLHRQSLLYSSSTTTTRTVTDSFANYLVDSLGFSHRQALFAYTKLSKYRPVNDFNFEPNANSVITFFRHYGFDDTRIRKIVSIDPGLLTCNVDTTLYPKFKFLLDHGFSSSDLTRLISVHPQLLRLGIESSILPTFQILRQVLGCLTLAIPVFKKLHTRHFRGVINNLLPNVDLLTSYGIPIELIRKRILLSPGTFLQNPERLSIERLIRVENEIGIARDSPMFMWGIHLSFSNSEEAIQSKCRIFKSFGWTQSDVDTFMMKTPCCFALSEATIRKKLGFVMNKLQLKPAYLITHSPFFTYSLEKRIVPRHKVLLILTRKGLLQKNPSLYNAICMSESRFLEMFVIPFKEVHQVYAKLSGCSIKMLTQSDCMFQERLALPII